MFLKYRLMALTVILLIVSNFGTWSITKGVSYTDGVQDERLRVSELVKRQSEEQAKHDKEQAKANFRDGVAKTSRLQAKINQLNKQIKDLSDDKKTDDSLVNGECFDDKWLQHYNYGSKNAVRTAPTGVSGETI